MNTTESVLIEKAEETLESLETLSKIDPHSKNFLRSMKQYWVDDKPVNFLYKKMREADISLKTLLDICHRSESVLNPDAKAKVDAIEARLEKVNWDYVADLVAIEDQISQ